MLRWVLGCFCFFSASAALNHCNIARYAAAALTSYLLENKSKTSQVNLYNPP